MLDDLLNRLLAQPAFAIIRARTDEDVTLIGGTRQEISRLSDIPVSPPMQSWSQLVVVPFSQLHERGLHAHDDGAPLTVINGNISTSVRLADMLDVLPDDDIDVIDRGGFETTDAEYSETVRRVIDDEIGQGAGANVVIGRRYRAQIGDWSHRRALSVLRRLLENERGSFWTFCIYTGERWLIGASPERHVSVDAGQVRMNPISGTFRLRGLEDRSERKRELMRFLSDEKEIYELFMVVDEELKMMCDICHEGGLVLGPYLKAMTHLVHTEYLLAGRTRLDVRQVLRDTMFAATVTGSPVESACRMIHRYEPQGRGYYGAIAALIGRDDNGEECAEAPILIRTADIDAAGNLTVSAGATLVRDSDPEYETAETWAKAAGVLSAFGLVDTPARQDPEAVDFDDDVLIALGSRNQRLSRFWLTDQSGRAGVPELAAKRALVLDGEDAFVNMLTHILAVLGMRTDVLRHEMYEPGVFDDYDLAVIGPGPGDPRSLDDPKIASMRAAVDELMAAHTPFLAVCLGHQILAGYLGFDLVFKDIVFQGTQSQLRVLDRTETVGFYNTFVARQRADLPSGVEVQADPPTGDVHLIAGRHFRGIQFHAESILTQNGDEILSELIRELVAPTGR